MASDRQFVNHYSHCLSFTNQATRTLSADILELLPTLEKFSILMSGPLPLSTVESQRREAVSVTFPADIKGSVLIRTGTIVKTLGDPVVTHEVMEHVEFCLNMIVTVLLSSHDAHVLYLDSSGSFSATRLKEIAMDTSQEYCDSMLTRVTVLPVADVFQLLHHLSSLNLILDAQDEAHKATNTIRLIIIDSLAALLQPNLGCDLEVVRLSQDISSVVRVLAYEYSIAVMYTVPESFVIRRKGLFSKHWHDFPDMSLYINKDLSPVEIDNKS